MNTALRILLIFFINLGFAQEEIISVKRSEGFVEEKIEEAIIPVKEKYELGILDSVRPTVERLIFEMDSLYLLFQQRNKLNDFELKAVTVYSYPFKNQSIEKSVSSGNYSMIKKNDDQEYYNLSYYFENIGLKLVLYDSVGRRIQEEEIDEKHYRKHSFSYQGETKGDTTIVQTFEDGFAINISKFIKISPTISEMISFYGSGEKNIQWRYEFSPDGKQIVKEFTRAYSYDYELERENSYNHAGQIQCWVEKDLLSNKVKECDFIYNSDGKIYKKEDYENGNLTHTLIYTYDKKGNVIAEEYTSVSGQKIYSCIYEYDSENRKIVYLYYYFI